MNATITLTDEQIVTLTALLSVTKEEYLENRNKSGSEMPKHVALVFRIRRLLDITTPPCEL